MKKVFPVLLTALLLSTLLATGSASAEDGFAVMDGKAHPARDYSSRTAEADTGRVYSASEQAKIDAALRQARLAQEIEKGVQPGEIRLEGTINGRPLYARAEASTQELGNDGAA